MKPVLTVFMLFLLVTAIAVAHEDEEHSTNELEQASGQVDNRRATNDWSGVSPIFHFREGNYFAGIFIIVFWILALKGFYDLIILVIGRAMHSDE